jgi:hypothetical protein
MKLALYLISFLLVGEIGCSRMGSGLAGHGDSGQGKGAIELIMGKARVEIYPASEPIIWLPLQKRFSPDTNLIMKLYPAMQLQYCDAKYRFIRRQVLEDSSRDRSPEQRNQELTGFLKTMDCTKFDRSDKQICGYTNAANHRMLWIELIDLSNDDSFSLSISNEIGEGFISGAGDWFERHTEPLVFNIDLNRLEVPAGSGQPTSVSE